jgi:hypothetical protein
MRPSGLHGIRAAQHGHDEGDHARTGVGKPDAPPLVNVEREQAIAPEYITAGNKSDRYHSPCMPIRNRSAKPRASRPDM